MRTKVRRVFCSKRQPGDRNLLTYSFFVLRYLSNLSQALRMRPTLSLPLETEQGFREGCYSWISPPLWQVGSGRGNTVSWHTSILSSGCHSSKCLSYFVCLSYCLNLEYCNSPLKASLHLLSILNSRSILMHTWSQFSFVKNPPISFHY